VQMVDGAKGGRDATTKKVGEEMEREERTRYASEPRDHIHF
jgi:hypothetical protein